MIPILTNFDIHATTRTAFSARGLKQVDWFRVVTELRGRGHSLETISKAIDVPKSTIHRWTDGAVPNYTDGLALMDLWRETMTSPPMTVKRPRM